MQDRIASYIAKTTPTTVGLKIAEMLTTMKSRFTVGVTAMVAVETQVQGLLNGLGTVVTADYPFYMAFARELQTRQYRGIEGPGLTAWAVTCCAKWVSYGLTESVLQDVADTVFGIVIP